jgi:hypothetical protein
MSSQWNLTGRWFGHYEQQGRQHPITADLVQEGADLIGSMQDGQPDRDYSLFEAAVEAGLPPGADEQIDANLRAMMPDAPSAAIRCISHLPADSRLEGRCNGRIVSFVKTYTGTAFSGYKIGDKILGTEKEGHSVHYQGKLSPNDLEIEGRWWIEAEPRLGTRRTEGLFLLRRKADEHHPCEDKRRTSTSPVKNRSWWKFFRESRLLTQDGSSWKAGQGGRSGLTLTQQVSGVRGEGAQAIDPTRRPEHLDRLDLIILAESEVNPAITGRLVTPTAVPERDLAARP